MSDLGPFAVPPGSPFAGERLDPARMRRERLAKLQAGMAQQGVDGLVLIGLSAVTYATGARTMAADLGRSLHQRIVALVPAQGLPHLLTPYPEGAPPELPAAHVHPPADLESEAGVATLAGAVRDLLGAGAIAVDDYTAPMHFHLARHLGGGPLGDTAVILGGAKICKTPDELECIRRAQHINEMAMSAVQAGLRPGRRQSDLSGVFLRRIFELGATGNAIDPIWQVMAPSIAAGPFTTHGHVAFPTPTTDRLLGEGDLVWVDTGISYLGYASDFGRTWIVADRPRPTSRQLDQFRRWRDVVDRVLAVTKPGATAGDLTRAACEGLDERPWLPHFYLAHGVGVDSAEMPLVGTDLGAAFDDSMVLAPGMVLVLEPVIWDDGHGGYRSEEIVAVTETGWVQLSDYPYAPYA